MEIEMSNALQTATVHSLARLAEIAPAEGVSLRLVTTEGQVLSPHSTPFDALAQCVQCRGSIAIDRTDQDLGADDVMLIPSNHLHTVEAFTDFKVLLVASKAAC